VRKTAVLASFLAVLAACGEEAPSEPIVTDPASDTVSMPGFSFSPYSTTIRLGGTIVFDFPAEPHNVIFERLPGAPTDIQVTSRRTVSRTFAVAGTFPYDCTLHPGMSGAVVVR
jgi:plastocyanin